MHTGRLKERRLNDVYFFTTQKMFKFTENVLLPPKM